MTPPLRVTKVTKDTFTVQRNPPRPLTREQARAAMLAKHMEEIRKEALVHFLYGSKRREGAPYTVRYGVLTVHPENL